MSGPDPKRLIDPVPADDIADAVRIRLWDWRAWAVDEDDPDWRLPRAHKAYVVETMCRALDTLVNGRLSSKQAATEWAQRTLHEP